MSEKTVTDSKVKKVLTVGEEQKQKIYDSVVIKSNSFSRADSEGIVRTLTGGTGRL